MQTVVSQLADAFRAAIRESLTIDTDPLVTPSQNPALADYQSNAAMSLAKQVAQQTGNKTNPRAVAEQIKVAVEPKLEGIASEITIAGPGFINIRLKPAWLSTQLTAIESDQWLGVPKAAHPQTVLVDYSGPNVAKQMHVGHLRSTIIGDCLSRVFEFLGHRVVRQNHIGDWGTQFGMLIAHLRGMSGVGEAHIEDLDRFYKEARKRFDSEPAFADESRANVVRLQAGGAEEIALWQRIVEESRRHFQPIYDRLGVRLTREDERGESFYNPMLRGVVDDLKAAKIAEASDGAATVFTEGHTAPIIVEKTGGGFGYATTDLAAIRYRVGDLKADRIIYLVGSPQSQHFQQVFATAKKAGWADGVTLEHANFGSILGDDGKMFKARSGDSVKLKELLDEAEQRAFTIVTEKNPDLPETQRRQIAKAVGLGAIKYVDLSKDRIGDYVFDWDKMLSFDGNTAPYLQYAYARIRSIFRRAAEAGAKVGSIDAQAPHELALGKQLVRFSEIVEAVARELKPHHLCGYLYDVATKFSGFFESCPVIQSAEPLRSSRLALCDLTARTLACGLDLLGIEHPEQM